jgi:hypothetical protein
LFFQNSAFEYDDQVFSYRLYSFNSVFIAKLYDMYQPLPLICYHSQQYYLVCTDSLGTFQSPSGYSPDHLIFIENLIEVAHLHKSGKSVVFWWVPGHTGLLGNEAANAAAKVATLHGTLASDRALGSYVCTFLYRAVLSAWQGEWANTQGNKLCMVKPSMQVWRSSIRKENVTLTRLWIGHMHLTHFHLLHGEPAPLCITCGAPLIVAHILVDCPHYSKACYLHQLHGILTFLVTIVIAFLMF